MDQVLKAIRKPALALRVLSANLRKFKMNERKERYSIPIRLSNLLGLEEEVLRSYHKEIYSEEHLLKNIYNGYQELQKGGELSGNTSTIDAETMYVVCRAIKPENVIQTGVQYGSYDAYILSALKRNRKGSLHSVDLPGEPSEGFEYGHLIPDNYQNQWNLHLGDAADILPELCEEVSPEIFLHDSKHTTSHMEFEYKTAYDYLPKGGILASHDVLLSDVFNDFSDSYGMEWTRIRNTGIALK
jgi:hypothetical protein